VLRARPWSFEVDRAVWLSGWLPVCGPITDEGVAFDSDTATGMMPAAQRRRRANVLAIVTYRQEVSPMNAVSAVGAPLQSTIARLR
jgi:hypothetical protein